MRGAEANGDDTETDLQRSLTLHYTTLQASLFMVSPKEQRGIHCRFGQSGVIAENHFDGSRNMIALIGGERRYILSKPSNCKNMHLLPRDHPSGRHSAVDWSKPDLKKFPRFESVTSNEVS